MNKRRLQTELMDDPALDRAAHLRALRGLARLNKLSPPAPPVIRGINLILSRQAAQSGPLPKQLRILDIATGSADLPIALYKARRHIVTPDLHLTGADISLTALEAARQRAAHDRIPLETIRLDVTEDPIPSGHHIITCSLFLHHLSDDQIVSLLSRAVVAARFGVVITDLVRSRLNLGLIALAARLVTRSAIVHTDAARSVRAALTPSELIGLTQRANLSDFVLHSAGLCRMMLTCCRPVETAAAEQSGAAAGYTAPSA